MSDRFECQDHHQTDSIADDGAGTDAAASTADAVTSDASGLTEQPEVASESNHHSAQGFAHQHGLVTHEHPHHEEHAHLMRMICAQPECFGYPTHDIHPESP